ncbi:MAG: hypothetical protein BMS9Abin05_1649 [Rhodothermia bacterium]|nr:MAG: hypothetical protein BMS9Abin05_1649 [Rhodothermia bacterium]
MVLSIVSPEANPGYAVSCSKELDERKERPALDSPTDRLCGQRRYFSIGEKACLTHWLKSKDCANHKHREQKRVDDEIGGRSITPDEHGEALSQQVLRILKLMHTEHPLATAAAKASRQLVESSVEAHWEKHEHRPRRRYHFGKSEFSYFQIWDQL